MSTTPIQWIVLLTLTAGCDRPPKAPSSSAAAQAPVVLSSSPSAPSLPERAAVAAPRDAPLPATPRAPSKDAAPAADDDEATLASPAPRKRRAERDTSPRSSVDVRVRRGESMGLYARWVRLAMRELYARTPGLDWGATLAARRTLALSLTAGERARFDAGRASFHRVREAAHSSAASETYKVRRGDSSWGIARRRGVPLWLLERLNPDKDLSRLSVGDEIRVPARSGES